jgi:hypothetical protein
MISKFHIGSMFIIVDLTNSISYMMYKITHLPCCYYWLQEAVRHDVWVASVANVHIKFVETWSSYKLSFSLRKESGLRIIPHLGDWWILFGLNLLWLCNGLFFTPLCHSENLSYLSFYICIYIYIYIYIIYTQYMKSFLSVRFIIVHCHYTIFRLL